LRAAVPRWLAEPAMQPRVLAVTPAMPKDGGGGALYILLRRER
jgi:DNA-nicking Smr family endonuclease